MPRVLYSFPHRIGAGRICHTAWQQVRGGAAAGAKVTVLAGSVERDLGSDVDVRTTLSVGGLKLPYRLLGRYRTLQLHDWITARWLMKNHKNIDLVHGWPTASLRTIKVAKEHGIPFLLERPNAHTAYAYEAASAENRQVGIELPANHDHSFDSHVLQHEEREYEECDYLLVPSDFVAKTFVDRGTKMEKMLRHHYGFDDRKFGPSGAPSSKKQGFTALYAGVCEPRKGLHYALDAWLASDACGQGKFLVCGEFVPGYAETFGSKLQHPSVEVLGHRTDLPDLMRDADVFVLSSVEEGSALVTYEARGAGCVLLVSDASGAHCTHEVDALVHSMRDRAMLTEHLNQVFHEPQRLSDLRAASLQGREDLTWDAAGASLLSAYRTAL